jgi:hypothetical protein
MTEETPHQPPKDEDSPIVTRGDIVSVIKSLPSRKAPGPDGIRNEQLKQLPLGAGSFLAIIFTACFRLGYFPQQWKKARIICLPKPGKPPRIIGSYRPISLLDSIGKLMERIILPHLLRFLAEENILPDFQFGFRREHCTHHALLRVTGFITDAFNLKACCAAAFLDVSKAFDRVWHEGLAWKLKHLRFPTWLHNTIVDFLTNRSFHVSWKGEASTERRIRAGVPQGSVIAPHLYSIFTADFPRDFGWNAAISLFADDTALLCRSFTAKGAATRLQSLLNAAAEWSAKWRTAINPAKTQTIIFRRIRRKTPAPDLRLLGQTLTWTKTATYLGIELDEHLTYKDHTRKLLTRAAADVARLAPLLRSADITVADKLRIHRSILLPRILYASPVWSGVCQRGPLTKLQLRIRRTLRLITGFPKWIGNAALREYTGEPSLEERLETTARRFFSKAGRSSKDYIAELTAAVPQWWDKYSRPISSTGLAEHQPPKH